MAKTAKMTVDSQLSCHTHETLISFRFGNTRKHLRTLHLPRLLWRPIVGCRGAMDGSRSRRTKEKHEKPEKQGLVMVYIVMVCIVMAYIAMARKQGLASGPTAPTSATNKVPPFSFLNDDVLNRGPNLTNTLAHY